ncbi:unnamed protein product [Closterium sp. NIES-53]
MIGDGSAAAMAADHLAESMHAAVPDATAALAAGPSPALVALVSLAVLVSSLALFVLRQRAASPPTAPVGAAPGGGSKYQPLATKDVAAAVAANGEERAGEGDKAERDEEKVAIGILFGTQTGTSEGFAKTLVSELQHHFAPHCTVELSSLDDLAEDSDAFTAKLNAFHAAFFLVATYGDGEPTDDAQRFFKWVHATTADAQAEVRTAADAQAEVRTAADAQAEVRTAADAEAEVRTAADAQAEVRTAADAQAEGVREGEGVGEGVREGMGEGVGEGVREGMGEGVGEGVREGMGEGVGEGVREGMGEGVGEGLWEGMGEGAGKDGINPFLKSCAPSTSPLHPPPPPRQDYIYREELAAYEESGVLSALHVAFSRDGPAKVYVQHLLKQQAERVWQAVGSGGGSVYVCGDAKAMARDVHHALLEVAVEQGKMAEEEAVALLDGLAEQGRYLRDIW